MTKRKKKKTKGPRQHRMNRKQRLCSARDTDWVSNYTGNTIIKGYRKQFGVDILCAITELRTLGVVIDQKYEEQARRSLEGAARARKRKKAEHEATELWPDSDAAFAHIAGYTPGGAPFGVTWNEVEENPPWADKDDSIEHQDALDGSASRRRK